MISADSLERINLKEAIASDAKSAEKMCYYH